MQLHCGDSAEILKQLTDNSVDALVTDPPAGISFMGKSWDGDKGGRKEWCAWLAGIMRECLRVMKPGAHGLVWALPRTSHWTATALEDAGFEIRDVIMHLFGQGFPKSLDVSKAIDKMNGDKREVLGKRTDGRYGSKFQNGNNQFVNSENNKRKEVDSKIGLITRPASAASAAWSGWGTTLKPACEHWILVRKSISEKTVAANVLKWGTGAINIDGSRIPVAERDPNWRHTPSGGGKSWINPNGYRPINNLTEAGRFPANLVFSHSPDCTDGQCAAECAVSALDEQTKDGRAGKPNGSFSCRPNRPAFASFMENSAGWGELEKRNGYESGPVSGASRFFYCAKISSGERNAGLEGMPATKSATKQFNQGMEGRLRSDGTVIKGAALVQNTHPTVKPQKLMRYLCRLITPPKGVVLDPFMGSGSTGLAARSEGFDFIGIEQSAEYFAIAEARLKARCKDGMDKPECCAPSGDCESEQACFDL